MRGNAMEVIATLHLYEEDSMTLKHLTDENIPTEPATAENVALQSAILQPALYSCIYHV